MCKMNKIFERFTIRVRKLLEIFSEIKTIQIEYVVFSNDDSHDVY